VPDRGERTDSAVKERVDVKRQDPTPYAVVLLNDDYTPMQFVVDVLESLFEKMPAEAHRIMMQVHVNGRGIAGVYPWEVAETKADKVASLASHAGHPLRATVEEV
jgi:ATP-dependent Clp protease adaptor protein ClpS